MEQEYSYFMLCYVLEVDNWLGRMYPGFWSQSGIRLSGFSDMPLTVPQDAEVFNDIFEAKYVTEYLEKYIDDHVYCGKSLRERIKFGFEVSAIQKTDRRWRVTGCLGGEVLSFQTPQLIVATGTTSEPSMPVLVGDINFGGQILHQADYGRYASQKPSEHQSVAVIGGGKSAADVVYGLVKAGSEVHWIIRKSGEGPGAFTNPADNAKGPFMNDPELAATRLFATLSPQCYSETDNVWTWFLHKTFLGNKLVEGFWNSAHQKCKKIGDFHHRRGALKGFEQLESQVKCVLCQFHLASLLICIVFSGSPAHSA